VSTPPPPPVITHPAGWYLDPAGQGQRYWDGFAWTNHLAPFPPYVALPQEEPQPATGDWIGAVLLPLLMPLVGLIAGLIWALVGGTKRQPGLVCLGASAVMMLAWIVVINTS
jgi:hypothetical protein